MAAKRISGGKSFDKATDELLNQRDTVVSGPSNKRTDPTRM